MFAFAQSLNAQTNGQKTDYPFKMGETLTYSMSYGWFEIGEVVIALDDSWWYINGSPRFYMRCSVATKGFFSFFAKLDICMESWIDPKTLRPTRSHREATFGDKIDVRSDHFSYKDSVRIETFIQDENKWRHHTFENGEIPLLDPLSSYLFLRDAGAYLSKVSIPVRTYFSNEVYPFGITYQGLIDYKWEEQQMQLRKYQLLFPVSDAFPKEKRAYVLATNDQARRPIKFLIEMSFGDFTFELKKTSR